MERFDFDCYYVDCLLLWGYFVLNCIFRGVLCKFFDFFGGRGEEGMRIGSHVLVSLMDSFVCFRYLGLTRVQANVKFKKRFTSMFSFSDIFRMPAYVNVEIYKLFCLTDFMIWISDKCRRDANLMFGLVNFDEFD